MTDAIADVRLEDLAAVVRHCRALGIVPMLTGLDHDWDLIRVMLDAYEQGGGVLPSLFEGEHYRIIGRELLGPVHPKALAHTIHPLSAGPPNETTEINWWSSVRHYADRACVLTGVEVRWEGELTLRVHRVDIDGRWLVLPAPDDTTVHGIALPPGGGVVHFWQPFQVATRYGETQFTVQLKGPCSPRPVPVTIGMLGHTFAYAPGDHGPDRHGEFLVPEWIGHFSLEPHAR